MVTQICQHIAELRQRGRKFALVVVAEGVHGEDGQPMHLIGEYSGQAKSQIAATPSAKPATPPTATWTGRNPRHGAGPHSAQRHSYRQRSAAGRRLWPQSHDLIAEGRYNRMVVWEAGRVRSKDLHHVIAIVRDCHQRGVCPSPVEVDSTMVKVARSLGIYVGDPATLPSPTTSIN
jgi:ATP-dependent phosphofructokinase / diphosphate-dependent phosphofructokinase